MLSGQTHLQSLSINRNRLNRSLEELQSFILDHDTKTCTYALTEGDIKGRRYFIEQMQSLNLNVDIDAIGNIRATKKGIKDLPPITIGGYLDCFEYTTTHSGALSLALGIEVIKVLEENNLKTYRPLSIVYFTNTEGKRFTPNLLGSFVFSQTVPLEEMLCVASNDLPKVTLGKVLKERGFSGRVYYKYKPIHSFIEILTDIDIPKAEGDIGLIEGAFGNYWTAYNLSDSKKINSQFLSKCAEKLRQQFPSALIRMLPSLSSKEIFVLDLRHNDARQLNHIQVAFDNSLRAKTSDSVLKKNRKELVRLAPVSFEEGIIKVIEGNAKALAIQLKNAQSTKALNSQVLMEKSSTATLYISCPKNSRQSIINIEKGAQLLLQSILDLAKV